MGGRAWLLTALLVVDKRKDSGVEADIVERKESRLGALSLNITIQRIVNVSALQHLRGEESVQTH